jgi:NAD(P)-dependent dehydrogenase (short-subunit alcohol dehydrogenase family)
MAQRATLITGAARRIARALALHFAAEGWDIGVHYRDSEAEARELAAEIAALGRRASLYRADLRDVAAIEALAAGFRHDFPAGDLLINSASVFERDRIDSLTPALWERHMAVNALAPALLCRAFVAGREGPLAVINFLDQKVANLTPDFFSYTASKVTLEAITRMLAMELAPRVRVNAIAPGLVLPSGRQSEESFQRAYNATPLQVGPTLNEICRAASLLAESPAITGQIITVDGGRHLVPGRPPYDDLPAG